jgi:hypothetical protein
LTRVDVRAEGTMPWYSGQAAILCRLARAP